MIEYRGFIELSRIAHRRYLYAGSASLLLIVITSIAYLSYSFELARNSGLDGADDLLLSWACILSAFTIFILVVATERTAIAHEERAKAKREVEQQRTWLEAIMCQMPVGVAVLVNPDHDLVLANVQYYTLLKLDPNLRHGPGLHRDFKVFDAQGEPCDPMQWPSRRAALSGEAVMNEELVVERGDGEKVWLLVSAAPIVDSVGSVSAVVVTFTDVTERKVADAAYAGLMHDVINAQEDERRRIARELHDELGQDLTGLAIGLKGLEPLVRSDVHETIWKLRASVQSMNDHVHHLTARLRPLMLEDFGLQHAIEELTLSWANRLGAHVDMHLEGLGMTTPESAAIVAYRVVQEALTNIAKHAGASAISVTAQLSGGVLRIVIEDDGTGFETKEPLLVHNGHYGLSGMAERLAIIGGSLHIESSLGAGTTVYAIRTGRIGAIAMIPRETCRMFLVDDHPFILWGVKSLLESQTDIQIVGCAGDADSAFASIGTLKPDLVIVDGTLPGTSGIALVERLHKAWPQILTLALTLHEEGPYVRQFLKAGVNGFVLKRSAAEDLLRAIRSVMQGGTYIDPAIASKVITSSKTSQSHVEALSEREESVVRLVAEGFSNKEISKQLGISVKTVETYRARACEKLGIKTRAALVRHALAEGWLTGG